MIRDIDSIAQIVLQYSHPAHLALAIPLSWFKHSSHNSKLRLAITSSKTMPSIKEQDLLTRGAKLRKLALPIVSLLLLIFFPIKLFFPEKPEDLYKDGEVLVNRIFLCSMTLAIHTTLVFACLLRITSIVVGNTEVYKDQIQVLRVMDAKCTGCHQCTRMEVYRDHRGAKTERIGNVEYTWQDTRTRVHCTSCGFDVCCDEIHSTLEDTMETGSSKSQRRRNAGNMDKHSLTEHLLSHIQVV